MAVRVVLRRWGNSIGGVFPKDFIENRNLDVNDVILVDVVRQANLSKIFGSLKGKRSGQKFKDMVREGWK